MRTTKSESRRWKSKIQRSRRIASSYSRSRSSGMRRANAKLLLA
jgi:hypothetical protein